MCICIWCVFLMRLIWVGNSERLVNHRLCCKFRMQLWTVCRWFIWFEEWAKREDGCDLAEFYDEFWCVMWKLKVWFPIKRSARRIEEDFRGQEEEWGWTEEEERWSGGVRRILLSPFFFQAFIFLVFFFLSFPFLFFSSSSIQPTWQLSSPQPSIPPYMYLSNIIQPLKRPEQLLWVCEQDLVNPQEFIGQYQVGALIWKEWLNFNW